MCGGFALFALLSLRRFAFVLGDSGLLSGEHGQLRSGLSGMEYCIARTMESSPHRQAMRAEYRRRLGYGEEVEELSGKLEENAVLVPCVENGAAGQGDGAAGRIPELGAEEKLTAEESAFDANILPPTALRFVRPVTPFLPAEGIVILNERGESGGAAGAVSGAVEEASDLYPAGGGLFLHGAVGGKDSRCLEAVQPGVGEGPFRLVWTECDPSNEEQRWRWGDVSLDS